MAISTNIPTSWKLPLFWATVDGSMAGGLDESQPAILVGQAFCAGAATGVLKAGSTGNGTISLDPYDPVLAGAVLGTYKVKMISATAFNVFPPSSAVTPIGTGIVGTEYENQVAFTITAGSTAFVATDEFDIAVTALPPGAAVYNKPIPVGSVAVAGQQFGVGSMLERMLNRFFAGNPTQQVWCLPVPDPSAGQPATGSIAFLASSLQSGVLTLYVAGQKLQIAVYSTDTAISVAANLVAAINAMTTLPVTATIDGSNSAQVDLACRWKGATGKDITLVFNYGGLLAGEVMPVGLVPTITEMSGGAGEPDFGDAIASIAAQQFLHCCMPFNDTGSLDIWDAEYGFGPGGRWSYARQQYGWVYNALRDDYADGLTWGLGHNSSVISTIVIEPALPSPLWEAAAAYCAQGAAALLADPAAPLQTLELVGILPAPVDQRFSQVELNDLANSGLAVQATDSDGVPAILREAMQYQLNAYGQSDTAFNLMTTLSNLAELLTRMKAAITTKFPRSKLAPDPTGYSVSPGPGQNVVTPSIIIAELVAEAQQAIYDGLMTNLTAFIANLVVQINDTDPNRLDVLWAPQLIGQLRDFDVLAQFRLQASPVTAS